LNVFALPSPSSRPADGYVAAIPPHVFPCGMGILAVIRFSSQWTNQLPTQKPGVLYQTCH
jgi:hypothetical protein